MRRFIDKVAIVAGAGQGIGSATVRRLAGEGARVVVADRVPEGAARVVDEVTANGSGAAIAFVGDLTAREVADELIGFTLETHGRIDALINIVGGTIWNQPFVDYRPDQILAEVQQSLWSTVWCCHAVLPQMLAQGHGAIVNLGSHSIASTLRVPYAIAKGGVMALTSSLAKEVAGSGIRVNCVAPHSTAAPDRTTPRHPDDARLGDAEKEARRTMLREREREIPMGRAGTAEEQAAAIAFMASDDASFVTGQILPVGGGATFPW